MTKQSWAKLQAGLDAAPSSAKPDIVMQPSDVGQSFTLTVQRHASKPMWRLSQVIVMGGKTTEKHTEWKTSPEFWPELLPANGRMRDFIFGELAHNPPAQMKGHGG